MKNFRIDGPALVMANVKDHQAARRLTADINETLMRKGFKADPEFASALLNLALIHCLAHQVDPNALVEGVTQWVRAHTEGTAH